MNVDVANSGLGMMMMIDDWDDDEYLFVTFLDHSEPSPLPPLRPLGHGGD